MDEFVATTGYHVKSAIRVLNGEPAARHRQSRARRSLYDEAARAAVIVLWEASDRVCGKRLRALLPILLPALERNGHLKLDGVIRSKVLAMSAATIDRLLRPARSARGLRKPSRMMPEPRRRVPLRTFADWHEPLPGSMEMDLVAHCGEVNRGSYISSLDSNLPVPLDIVIKYYIICIMRSTLGLRDTRGGWSHVSLSLDIAARKTWSGRATIDAGLLRATPTVPLRL
ncbi:MAG TPA: hypothetical protein VGR92_14270 [Steroidobacteraceae bacterium]|nr:hypothetical protein [Steroidobacteraceae bacterium]